MFSLDKLALAEGVRDAQLVQRAIVGMIDEGLSQCGFEFFELPAAGERIQILEALILDLRHESNEPLEHMNLSANALTSTVKADKPPVFINQIGLGGLDGRLFEEAGEVFSLGDKLVETLAVFVDMDESVAEFPVERMQGLATVEGLDGEVGLVEAERGPSEILKNVFVVGIGVSKLLEDEEGLLLPPGAAVRVEIHLGKELRMARVLHEPAG